MSQFLDLLFPVSVRRILALAGGALLCLPDAARAHMTLLGFSGWDLGMLLVWVCLLGLVCGFIFLRYRGLWLGYVKDERTRALDALRQSEAMYQGLFEMAPVGIYRSSLDGSRFLAVNQAATEMYGFTSPQQVLDKVSPLDVYTDPALRERIVSMISARGSVTNLETTFVRADGRLRTVLLTAKLYPDEEFIEGCVVDVTEYRNVQQELADKGRFLQAMLDAMATPLFYKTRDGKYRLINQAFISMLGGTPEALLGKTVFDVSPPDQARVYHEMDDVLFQAKGSAIQRYESLVSGAEGVRNVVFSKQTVLDAEGEVEGVLGVITDITQQKRQEKLLEEQHALLATLLESASDHIFYKDADGVYLGCSENFASSVGRTREEIVGRTDMELFSPDLSATFLANDRDVMQNKAPIMFDTEIPTLEGSVMMETVLAPMLTRDDEVLGVVGVARDVTRRKMLERELMAAERRYRTIFENAVEGIFSATVDGRIVHANPAAAQLFGFESVQALIREVNDIGMELYDDPEDRMRLIEQLKTQETISGFQARCKRRDGSTFWLSAHVRGIYDRNKELMLIEGIIMDVSQIRAQEQDLRQRASTDSLTGLPNRESLRRTCAHMLAQAQRSGEKVGVLFIDLDGFKEINDTWGHKTGDELLVQVSERLRWRLRQSDLAARLGGDEFAVLLWNVQGAEAIAELGRTLVGTLTGDYECSGEACSLSASVGASLYPENGQTVDELLDQADKAMYAVKSKGKKGFCLVADENGGDAAAQAPESSEE